MFCSLFCFMLFYTFMNPGIKRLLYNSGGKGRKPLVQSVQLINWIQGNVLNRFLTDPVSGVTPVNCNGTPFV